MKLKYIFPSAILSLFIFVFPVRVVSAGNVSVGELLTLTNSERVTRNMPPLKLNSQLNLAAQRKAIDMVTEGYWAHYSPSGKSPWSFIKSSGYRYKYTGENLARYVTTSEQTIDMWMNSELHRDNILSEKYKDVGFYVYEGNYMGKNGTLVVGIFGSKK